MVDRKRILAGADVTAIDASQSERFQMPDKVAITTAGLREGLDTRSAKVRRLTLTVTPNICMPHVIPKLFTFVNPPASTSAGKRTW